MYVPSRRTYIVFEFALSHPTRPRAKIHASGGRIFFYAQILCMRAQPDVSNVEKMWSKTEEEKEKEKEFISCSRIKNTIEPLYVMHEYI